MKNKNFSFLWNTRQ